MIARSMERLSSGSRLTPIRSDIAAYSLDVNLDSMVRGLTQATLNINETQGMLETAMSAIEVQLDILQRMRDLGIQGTSSTLTQAQRSQLNDEIRDLAIEFKRISSETEFSGQKVLDGSTGAQTLQLGAVHNLASTLNFELPDESGNAIFRKDAGSGRYATRVTMGPLSNGTTTEGTTQLALWDDVTGDGRADLIRFGSSGGIYSNVNNGHGVMLPSKKSSATQTLTSITEIQTHDMNGDGNKDIVAIDFSTTSIGVYLGNGDGTFQTVQTSLTTILEPYGYSIGDINEDGIADIVVGDGISADVSILIGNGDGTFLASSTTTTGNDTFHIRLADLNRDGHLDMIRGDVTGGAFVSHLGNGDGTFGSAITFTPSYAFGSVYDHVLADMTGDGILDLLFNKGSINFFAKGNGDGTFATDIQSPALGSGREIKVGDVNNDGIMDYVSGGSVVYGGIYLGNGDGTFSLQSTRSEWSSVIPFLFDIDGDSILDIGTYNTYSRAEKRNIIANRDLNVNSNSNATEMIRVIDHALEKVRSNLSSLSALHDRLAHSASYNLLLSDSLEEARITNRSIDYATETAELVRLQILQQAQVATVAHANMNLQVVLGLLQPN